MTNTDVRQTVRRGSRVLLHFSLSLPDGTEAVSTFGGEPEQVTLGEGSLSEGLEAAIIGLKQGERKTLELPAEQAFGLWNEDKLQSMSRSDFAPDLVLEPGIAIAFTTPSGEEVPGTIVEVGDDWVNVDFNHPLAGADILFAVEILDIQNLKR